LTSYYQQYYLNVRQVDDDETLRYSRLIRDTVAYSGRIYAIDSRNKALLLPCSLAWYKYQQNTHKLVRQDSS